MTPLCYAYLGGSVVLFAIWLVFFLLREDLHQEMLTMGVLIGVLSVVVSWGDVATAFHSTCIGNITVYLQRTKLLRSADIFGKLFGSLLRSKIGQKGLGAIVRRFPEGPPSELERSQHRSTIWAEAIDDSGRSSKAILSAPDGYDFAANSTLEVASRISSLPAPLGLVTPFQAFCADFVLRLPGCSRMDIPPS
jgi:short subunit dehydrogenase-like uncharacterized protein